MMVGYDLDGIIAQEGRLLDLLFRYAPAWGVRLRDSRLNRCIGYPTIRDAVIVTGRPTCDDGSTYRWLQRLNINLPVLHTDYGCDLKTMRKVDFVTQSMVAKQRIIKQHNLEVFVESDESTRNYLRRQTDAVIIDRGEALERGLLSKVPCRQVENEEFTKASASNRTTV